MIKNEKLKRAVIKEELVALTGDFIKAVTLNQFIYWSERIKNFDKFMEEEKARMEKEHIVPNMKKQMGWIYKTAEDLSDEIMLGVTPKTMRTHIKHLVDSGWLDERNNPNYKWDRTLQYRVNIRQIQIDLHRLGYALEGYPLQIDPAQMAILCKGQNLKMEREKSKIEGVKSKNQTTEIEKAIPETTSKTISKITSKTTDLYKGCPSEKEQLNDVVDKFDFNIFNKQIETVMDGIKDKDSLGNFGTKEVKDFFEMYYRIGSAMRGIEPIKLKNEQIANVVRAIAYIDKVEYEPDLDDYQMMIRDYFKQKFEDCDYSINHFISGDVMLMRYYNLQKSKV